MGGTGSKTISRDEIVRDGDELISFETGEDGWVWVLKSVPCGHCCRGCPHGPYQYRVRRNGDGLKWEFCGLT